MIDEKGSLWSSQGQVGDSYAGPYRIRYTLVPGNGPRGWVIIAGSVLAK